MDGAAGGVNIRGGVTAILFVVLSGCAAVTTRQEAVPTLWAGLNRGAHAVGFRTIGAIAMWYPASGGGEAIRFRDYVDSLDDLEKSLHADHFSDEAITGLFDTRMFARRDAVATKDKSPVVMIVMNEREIAADHAVLGEFLASHGYVVVAAGPKANIDAVQGGRPSLFLHTVGFTTRTFLSSPATAKPKAEKILAFVDAHFTS